MSREWELDSGLVSDITKSKVAYAQLVQLHYFYYSDLAFQRRQIRETLYDSLRERTKPFRFAHWQRTMRYKFSLDPLSAKGSLVDPGGRFNVGGIDPARYPMFAALYLASHKRTALAEVLGRDTPRNSLTPEELALAKPDSIAIVSITGNLESVLDIRDGANLAGFVNLINNFKLSSQVILLAKKLHYKMALVRTVRQLSRVLTEQNWRGWPRFLEVPHPCQVFGSVVFNAGIESILYESAITHEDCIAIFPENFNDSSSYIELDEPPPSDTVQTRLDSRNFKVFT